MGRPRLSEQQKLAKALEELRQIIGSDHGVVRGNQLKNSTRVLLLEKRFLREVLKGWYFISILQQIWATPPCFMQTSGNI